MKTAALANQFRVWQEQQQPPPPDAAPYLRLINYDDNEGILIYF